jgi:hypothetical protein
MHARKARESASASALVDNGFPPDWTPGTLVMHRADCGNCETVASGVSIVVKNASPHLPKGEGGLPG